MLTALPLSSVPITTPDEDPAAFAELIDTYVTELTPQTYLERRQIELIAYTDWEIARHRRQSASILSSEIQKIERQIGDAERNLLQPARQRQHGSQDTNPHHAAARTAECAAIAYAKQIHIHAHHEISVERLERRRRQLLKDFHDMKASRLRRDVNEAEVV